MQKISAGKFHSEPPSPFTSFDHLVGAREQRRRNFDAKCLRRIEVNNQLKFGRLQHRQVGGLGALKNFADIDAKLTISICAVVSVTDESACIRELTPFIDRGNSVSCRQRDDPAAATAEICIGGDEKSADLLLD